MTTIETIGRRPGRPSTQHGGFQPGKGIASPWPVIRMVASVLHWRIERRRSRRALEDLDDHMLRDLGLSRETALREARRPFWD